ncbi:hypothetical protein [Lacicoccus qingdaonensis]|uniref:Uncharacterized protein n=1 Tax=Lacicoccus qingdaonensis TaxID=576118 RepID=A0A1G9F3C1_9BACL|nr:hypothetical protein [Salinicoccus qingdaonensis]SDK82894.1 hypothetical protein SAMN05216216_110101 [Salinicoccus qingdaonensis]
MEREKKNPIITQIELDAAERRLKSEIDGVDRKHDKNYSDLAKMIAISEKTNEHIVSSNNRLSNSFDKFSSELKEELKQNRKSHETLSDKVRTHEYELSRHNEFIQMQQEVAESKKGQLVKWVSILSGIFVAIIAGLFGIVEVLLPIILGGE